MCGVFQIREMRMVRDLQRLKIFMKGSQLQFYQPRASL